MSPSFLSSDIDEIDVPVVERVIPSGWDGTAATIAVMQSVVSEAKRSWRMMSLVARILRHYQCPPKDHLAEAQALFDFVQQRIRFQKDPFGVETIRKPMVTLHLKAGDCDDLCTLLATLNESVGLRCQYATIKANPLKPNEFSHVYLLVHVPVSGVMKPIAEDASVPGAEFGWEPPSFHGKQLWPASQETGT